MTTAPTAGNGSSSNPTATPTVTEALHTTLELSFEDAVPFVQLEHELADFETVQVTRLDQMVAGMLGKDVSRTALIVVCHPEIAYDALCIDPTLAGLLPCTTVVYEMEPDADRVHVYHVSSTKAIRDLGCAPADCEQEVDELVQKTGQYMETVWENIQKYTESARGL